VSKSTTRSGAVFFQNEWYSTRPLDAATEMSDGLIVERVRLNELDALRGVAALSVVFFHYAGHFKRYYGATGLFVDAASYGHYGVQLFFMISGFVIFLTLEKTRGISDFIVGRGLRLFPAYWAVVLFISVLPCIFDREKIWMGGLVSNLTMIQSVLGWDNLDIVFWSLTVELGFYGAMCVIFYANGLKNFEHIAWVWVLMTVALPSDSTYGGGILPRWLSFLLVQNYANLFVLGIVFYRVRLTGWTYNRWALLFACLAAEYFLHGLESMTFVVAFSLLFLAINGRILKVGKGNPLLFLGFISYSLYLIHRNTGYRVADMLHDHGFSNLMTGLIALAGALLLALVLTLTVERPALRMRQMLRARLALAQGIA
jgi:peptidoglycan/LPS O-acetylase OafA/YrhL